MNLLPKSSDQFANTEYWNSFFKKRDNKSFDWYGDYFEVAEIIHKYVKPTDQILMVGCGNSKLSMDMYDNGFRDITNIDNSEVAIKKMIKLNSTERADMPFLQMDATAMTFRDESFSVALDKGTLDAICVEDTPEVHDLVVKGYFKEILRTMRNGGRYVCFSLLQDPILKYILEFFPKNSCMVRIVYCMDVERGKQGENMQKSLSVTMPVFVAVITKLKFITTAILEFVLNTDQIKRVNSADELILAVSSIQKAALVCNGLMHGNLAGHNEVKMELVTPITEVPRYTIYILDQAPARGLNKFAVFIVPHGREVEWLFSTPSGRKSLASNVKYQRLAVVLLHSDQEYESLDAIKSELSVCAKSIGPNGLTEEIPFLSVGKDLGKRETLLTGCSQISGDFRIEDVENDAGQIYRRLIFLNNQFVIQSEALMKTIKSKRSKKSRTKVDFCFLSCDHHLFMSAGVQLAMNNVQKNQPKDVLVIGLGGGGLCNFIHTIMSDVRVTAVEIDPIMLEISEQYFDVKQDERFHVVIDDGVAFLEKCKEESIHFVTVLFDVDNKDPSMGMSCPPKSFLEHKTLENVKEIIGANGLFILNLVCRDETLRTQTFIELRKFYKYICSHKLETDLNEVIFCSNSNKYKNLSEWKKMFETAADSLNKDVQKRELSKAHFFSIDTFLSQLSIE